MPQYQQFPKQLAILLTTEQYDWIVAEGVRRQVSAAEVVRQSITASKASKINPA